MPASVPGRAGEDEGYGSPTVGLRGRTPIRRPSRPDRVMPEQGGSVSQHNTNAVDVAVVGGGAIGLAVAWRARLRGLSVTLLERDLIGRGTSHVAAGMLAPNAEAAPAEEPLL